jgi:hypothetical protein
MEFSRWRSRKQNLVVRTQLADNRPRERTATADRAMGVFGSGWNETGKTNILH